MRHLDPGMQDYFTSKLQHNPFAQEMIAKKNARALMAPVASTGVGIREVGGNNRGPLVTLIQKTIGGPDHVAWCMSYVQTVIAYIELMTGVKSPIAASEHCMTVWNQTHEDLRVKFTPLAGAIVIWRHGNTTNGHTGIIESCDESSFYAFEGNTGSGVMVNGKVERDGDGIYHTHRSRSGTGDMHVVGYLKPF